MINILELIVIAIAALGSLAEIGFTQYKNYKHAPLQRKHQLREDMHNDLVKGTQEAKNIAKEAVITAAMDEHTNTGLSKKNKAVEIIRTTLNAAGFNYVPDKIIEVIVESSYQTTKAFIKQHNLDSRVDTVSDVTRLSSEEIQAHINGNQPSAKQTVNSNNPVMRPSK